VGVVDDVRGVAGPEGDVEAVGVAAAVGLEVGDGGVAGVDAKGGEDIAVEMAGEGAERFGFAGTDERAPMPVPELGGHFGGGCPALFGGFAALGQADGDGHGADVHHLHVEGGLAGLFAGAGEEEEGEGPEESSGHGGMVTRDGGGVKWGRNVSPVGVYRPAVEREDRRHEGR
jgi:hypothetical protein